MNAKELFERGEEKFDNGDITGAIEDYRQSAALMEESGSIEAFMNAQEYEGLRFFHNMKAKYPDSYSVLFYYAAHAQDDNNYYRAVETYTEMLNKFGNDREIEINLRSRRLRAACHLYPTMASRSYITEDLRYVWQLGESYELARRVRGVLVERLMKNLLHPEDADVLETLSQDELYAASVRELFALKARELRMWGDFRKEWKASLRSDDSSSASD